MSKTQNGVHSVEQSGPNKWGIRCIIDRRDFKQLGKRQQWMGSTNNQSMWFITSWIFILRVWMNKMTIVHCINLEFCRHFECCHQLAWKWLFTNYKSVPVYHLSSACKCNIFWVWIISLYGTWWLFWRYFIFSLQKDPDF